MQATYVSLSRIRRLCDMRVVPWLRNQTQDHLYKLSPTEKISKFYSMMPDKAVHGQQQQHSPAPTATETTTTKSTSVGTTRPRTVEPASHIQTSPAPTKAPASATTANVPARQEATGQRGNFQPVAIMAEGIPNFGLTCWASAVISLLRNSEPIRRLIEEEETAHSTPLTKALTTPRTGPTYAKEHVTTVLEITRSTVQATRSEGMGINWNNDACEVIEMFFSAIRVLKTFATFATIYEITCSSCYQQIRRVQSDIVLTTRPRKRSSVQREITESELKQIDRAQEWMCNSCHERVTVDIAVRREFRGRILAVRHTPIRTSHSQIIVYSSNVEEEVFLRNGRRFKLIGALHYSGTSVKGHWMSIVREGMTTNFDLINDSIVTRYDEDRKSVV